MLEMFLVISYTNSVKSSMCLWEVGDWGLGSVVLISVFMRRILRSLSSQLLANGSWGCDAWRCSTIDAS